jgi:hypothetical protein
MTSYKHTQVGYLLLAILLIVVVFFTWMYGVISTSADDSSAVFVATALMALIVFILASFSTLQVTVDEQYLRIQFGYGVFWKKFPLNEIASAASVKNHWYYGWGVRVWFWPYMWIYNVSGFDAVEITMRNGRIYRIGTDVPQELEAAIKRAV